MRFTLFTRLQYKLLMLAVLPASVIALLLTWYMTQSKIADIEDAIHQKGIAIAEHIAADTINVIFTRNETELSAKIQNYFTVYKDLVTINVTSSDSEFSGHFTQTNRQINSQKTLSIMAPIELGVSTEPLDDFLNHDQLPQEGQTIIGYVNITINDSTEAQKIQLIKTNIFIFLVALSIAALAVFPLSEKLTQPIRKLSEAFDKVRQGNFTQVPEESSDELLKLQQGFNLMSSSLSRQNERLNERVSQVTSDLETTLQALEIQNVELDIARKLAVESSLVKSEFLANMSHEIRTPMNGIVGFSNLLLNTNLNETQQEYARTISRSANILLQILNDILDFSKLETGKIEIHHYPFSLDDCIDEVLTIFTPSAHEKCLQLIPLVYEDVPRSLLGDKLRLIQVLSNLVSNAIKFTPSGEIIVRIMYEEVDADHCSLTFSVSDTGIGITETDQMKLFGPFQQISNSLSRGFSGTGLGLSISKSMVGIMGGNISVSSVRGQGSVFSFTLPFDIDRATEQQPVANNIFHGRKVQLFDQHRLSALSIRNTLERMGFQVACFAQLDDVDLSDQQENFILFSLACDQKESFDSFIRTIQIPEHYKILVLLNESDRSLLEQFDREYHVKGISKPVFARSLEQAFNSLISDTVPDSGNNNPDHDMLRQLLSDKTILIVDDNEINQSLLEALLRVLGVKVLLASNGYQAIEIAQATHTDLIFMDIHMPELDGIEATKTIRQIQTIAGKTLIVALTADIAFRNKAISQRYGFDDVLIKPIEPDNLNQTLLQFFASDMATWRTTVEGSPTESAGRVPEVKDYPIRDEQHALRITGGVRAVADKLFVQLIEQLPGYAENISSYFERKDWSGLWQVVHKLHGASAVCSVPALHHAANELQTVVKNNDQTLIADKLAVLLSEIERLLDYARNERLSV